MKRIITTTLSISLLTFPLLVMVAFRAAAGIAQPATTTATQVQGPQVDKRQLIAVAASATQNKDYQLALRVADNTIELFPRYGTGYLYKAIALYRLGEEEASRFIFDTAKILYTYQLKSKNITLQEKKEALLGLETAKLHLKLLSSQL